MLSSLDSRSQQKDVTIKFNTNGGELIDSIETDGKSKITMPDDPVKIGYDFMGWDQEIPEIQKEDLTLATVWKKKSYTISFNSNGGSEIQVINQEYNSKIGLLEHPTKEDHLFKGWYKDNEFNTLFADEYITDMNISLYAKWNPIHI